MSAALAGIFSSSIGFDHPSSASPQRAALWVDAQHWHGFYVDLSGYLKVTCFFKTLIPNYYKPSIWCVISILVCCEWTVGLCLK